MKTYLAFRMIGMNQSESMYCAAVWLKQKEGAIISNAEKESFDKLRVKYSDQWSNLIGRI